MAYNVVHQNRSCVCINDHCVSYKYSTTQMTENNIRVGVKCFLGRGYDGECYHSLPDDDLFKTYKVTEEYNNKYLKWLLVHMSRFKVLVYLSISALLLEISVDMIIRCFWDSWFHCARETLNQGSSNLILEGRCPAEFSSNLPQHTCMEASSIPSKTLISCFRCV